MASVALSYALVVFSFIESYSTTTRGTSLCSALLCPALLYSSRAARFLPPPSYTQVVDVDVDGACNGVVVAAYWSLPFPFLPPLCFTLPSHHPTPTHPLSTASISHDKDEEQILGPIAPICHLLSLRSWASIGCNSSSSQRRTFLLPVDPPSSSSPPPVSH